MADVFLGLGSNQGDRIVNIKKALELLNGFEKIEIKDVSSLYESEPLGTSRQPDFVNCVIRIETDFDPHSLLKIVKSVETAMGRKPATHLLPRPMDIDIILYDDIELDSFDLLIPHSRLKTRRFVLEPLLEIDAEILDPSSLTPLKMHLEDLVSQKLEKVMDSVEVWDGSSPQNER
jgi:2-amino-4-hydroxy-6-hydroxymethyldihydropteridine diphosphokinase